MCTLSKHSVTEFLMISVISFVQHTLAFITSLFFDRMIAQSRNFYENNILRFILSDPAKSGLESSAWIDGYDFQNTDTHKKKKYHYKKRYFFSEVYHYKPHVIPQSTSCYFCHFGRHPEYFTTLKHNNNNNNNNNTTTSCQSNSRNPTTVENYLKEGY